MSPLSLVNVSNCDSDIEDEKDLDEDPPWCEVSPDDSITARGRHRSCKGKVRESDLARMRQLIERDDRFARNLDSSCRAVHELVASRNPKPALTVLANLVWRSLSVAWELDADVPKAKLRVDIIRLEDDVHRVQSEFEVARRCYLKELVSLRDQIRRFDPQWLVEVSNLVYDEEPVMYYEPLQYLEEDVRQNVSEIVEEKLKLLVTRLRTSDVPAVTKPVLCTVGTSPRPFVDTGKDDTQTAPAEAAQAAAAAAQAAAAAAAAARAAAERTCEELRLEKEEILWAARKAAKDAEAKHEETVKALRDDLSALRTGLASVDSETQESWRRLRETFEVNGRKVQSPPPELGFGSAKTAASDFRSQDVLRLASRIQHIQKTSVKAFTDFAGEIKGLKAFVPPPVADSSHLGAAASTAKLAQEAEDARLKSAAAEAAATAARLEAEERAARADSLQQELEALRAQFLVVQRQLAAAEDARAKAESSARSVAEELANMKPKAPPPPTEEKSSGVDETEHRKVLNENQKLRQEVQRLHDLLADLSSRRPELEQEITANVTAVKSGNPPLRWRTPQKNVFVRLFQDAFERKERRRNSSEAAQKARAEEILTALRQELRETTNFGEEETNLLMRLLEIRSIGPGAPPQEDPPPQEDDLVRFDGASVDIASAVSGTLGLPPCRRPGSARPSTPTGQSTPSPSRQSSGSPAHRFFSRSPERHERWQDFDREIDGVPVCRGRSLSPEKQSESEEAGTAERKIRRSGINSSSPEASREALVSARPQSAVATVGSRIAPSRNTAGLPIRPPAQRPTSAALPPLQRRQDYAPTLPTGGSVQAATSATATSATPTKANEKGTVSRAPAAHAFLGSREASLVREAHRLLSAADGSFKDVRHRMGTTQSSSPSPGTVSHNTGWKSTAGAAGGRSGAASGRNNSAPSLLALVGRRPPSAPHGRQVAAS